MVDGQPVDLGTPKERHLFGALALDVGTLVSRDRVIDALWPDRPPAKPASSLRAYVSHLRDALAASGLDREVLATEVEGYALRLDRSLLDIDRFEQLVRQAHEDDREVGARAALLDDALASVRGEPFADMPYAEFAQGEIHRLNELVATAHELRAELAVELGDGARWAPELAALVDRYPNRDRLCAALMRALVQAGRRSDALRAFSAHRERLIDEMGLDPGPDLRALELEILTMDAEDASGGADHRDDGAPERRLVSAVVLGRSSPAPDGWAAVVAAHGGTLDAHDGRTAWFGRPVAVEGHAVRAVRAALELPAGGPGGPGIGVASGWQVAGGEADDEDAARLAAAASAIAGAAAAGTVLVDDVTRRLAAKSVAFEPGTDGHFVAGATAGATALDTPTVGRDEELGLLRRRLERAADGEGQVVVVTGDAGVGKSRTIEALLAEVSDVRITRFACLPFHGGRAFHPVADVFAGGGVRAPRDGEPAALAAARRLLAAWAVDRDAALESVSADPEERRQTLLRAAVTYVTTADGPSICVVEDLHWADPSTEELVAALADATLGLPLTLIVSRRSGDDVAIAALPNATMLPLGGLARSELATIARGYAPESTPDAVIDEIATRAGGNPLFAEEMARSFDAGGRLDIEVVPASIHDSLLARLDRVPECKAVAQAAAVVGIDIDPGLLARVVDLDGGAVDEDLDRLCADGVLVRRGVSTPAQYRFRHALVRDAVHESLPLDRRAELHARTARALAQEPDPAPAALARHWTEAGEVLAAARAWHDAAVRSMAISALAEAIENAQRGLDVGRGDSSGEVASVVIDLHLTHGAAATQRFGPASDEAASSFAAVLDDPALRPDTVQRFRAQWGRWFVASTRGDSVLMLRLAVELLATALDTDDDEIRIEAHHAMWSTLILTGDFDGALQHTLSAKELYAEGRHHHLTFQYGGHDPGVCMWSIGGLARWMLGDTEQAVADAEIGLELANRLDHPYSQIEASFGPLTIAALDGDIERTEAITADLEALVDAQVVPAGTRGYVDGFRGAAALAAGDADRAAALLRPSVDAWRSLWGSYCAPLEGYVAETMLRSGDPDGAIAHLDAAPDVLGSAEWWDAELHRHRAAALVALGDVAEAVDEYQAAAQVAGRQAAVVLELRARTELAATRPDAMDAASRERLATLAAALPGARADVARAIALLDGADER